MSLLPPLSVFWVFYPTSMTLTKLLMSVNPTPESTIPDKTPSTPRPCLFKNKNHIHVYLLHDSMFVYKGKT